MQCAKAIEVIVWPAQAPVSKHACNSMSNESSGQSAECKVQSALVNRYSWNISNR